jgi:hypothetical protein
LFFLLVLSPRSFSGRPSSVAEVTPVISTDIGRSISLGICTNCNVGAGCVFLLPRFQDVFWRSFSAAAPIMAIGRALQDLDKILAESKKNLALGRVLKHPVQRQLADFLNGGELDENLEVGSSGGSSKLKASHIE